jgi:hypothetical protein
MPAASNLCPGICTTLEIGQFHVFALLVMAERGMCIMSLSMQEHILSSKLLSGSHLGACWLPQHKREVMQEASLADLPDSVSVCDDQGRWLQGMRSDPQRRCK